MSSDNASTDAAGNRQTYFALETDPKVLGDLIMQRQRAWQGHMRATGRLREIRDSHSMYFGRDRDFTGSNTRRVTRKKKGEVLDLRLNQFGALLRSIVTLTTAQDPAWEPKAESTDTDAQQQTILTEHLLEDYRLRKDLRQWIVRWVSHAVKYTSAYLGVEWDEHAGPDVSRGPNDEYPEDSYQRSPDDLSIKSLAKEGDVVFSLYSPLDVAYDYRGMNPNPHWRIYRSLKNRFELAARLPNQEEAEEEWLRNRGTNILNCDTDAEFIEFRLSLERRTQDLDTSLGTDEIPIYDFWHARTTAVPNGLHVKLLSNGEIILKEECIYDEPPFIRLSPEEFDDTPHGHSVALDLQGIQQGIDQSASYALTKENASLPRMIIPEAANLTASDLSVGMAVLKMRGGKDNLPTILEPQGRGAESSIATMGWLQKQAETISGVNSVVRGNPEDALKDGSGAALSLIQAQAYLNNTQLQGNYTKGLGKIGTAIVRAHQLFNKFPRKLEALSGKGRSQAVQWFTGEHLKGISRVIVEAGSPQTQSVAFRMQLLEGLMKMGIQVDPQRLLSFVQTGKWETVIEDPSQEDLFIRQENEALRTGKEVPPAVWTENPHKHVLGHTMGVLNSIEAKSNPTIVQNTLKHIQSHIDGWMGATQNPQLSAGLMLLGFPMPPPPPPPPTTQTVQELKQVGPGVEHVQTVTTNSPGEPPKPTAQPHAPPHGHAGGGGPHLPGPAPAPGAPPGPTPNMPRMPTMPNGQPTVMPGVT